MPDSKDPPEEKKDDDEKTFFSILPSKEKRKNLDTLDPRWVFLDSKVDIFASLGSNLMTMSNILKLGRGAVIELDQKPDDYIMLLVENFCVAEAELTTQDNHLELRIVKIHKTPRPYQDL